LDVCPENILAACALQFPARIQSPYIAIAITLYKQRRDGIGFSNNTVYPVPDSFKIRREFMAIQNKPGYLFANTQTFFNPV